jgi:NIPSNAP
MAGIAFYSGSVFKLEGVVSMTSKVPIVNSAPEFDECSVIELRQYTLHPHKRDVLIDVFDREFVEAQEAVGMRVMGQFRDLDDPNRFVWLRGFADMQTRKTGLEAFYGGPVWAAHRSVANATMIDSDNVLLLRPAWQESAIPALRSQRSANGAVAIPSGMLDATIFYLKEAATPELLQFCREQMATTLSKGGAEVLGWYVTEASENTFPRLPVREGEFVLVGFAMFKDTPAFDAFHISDVWQRDIAPMLEQWLAKTPELHRLVPTARSAIHA